MNRIMAFVSNPPSRLSRLCIAGGLAILSLCIAIAMLVALSYDGWVIIDYTVRGSVALMIVPWTKLVLLNLTAAALFLGITFLILTTDY